MLEIEPPGDAVRDHTDDIHSRVEEHQIRNHLRLLILLCFRCWCRYFGNGRLIMFMPVNSTIDDNPATHNEKHDPVEDNHQNACNPHPQVFSYNKLRLELLQDPTPVASGPIVPNVSMDCIWYPDDEGREYPYSNHNIFG